MSWNTCTAQQQGRSGTEIGTEIGEIGDSSRIKNLHAARTTAAIETPARAVLRSVHAAEIHTRTGP